MTYTRDVKHLDKIDIYRILDLYGVESPALQHAIKKLLCSGQRGYKNEYQDVVEAAKSIDRWLDMRREDNNGAM